MQLRRGVATSRCTGVDGLKPAPTHRSQRSISQTMMIVKMPSPLPAMTNVTATGGDSNYGVYNNSSSPTIRNSSITGTTNSIFNIGTDPSAQVADTALGGSVTRWRVYVCWGVRRNVFCPQLSMRLTSASEGGRVADLPPTSNSGISCVPIRCPRRTNTNTSPNNTTATPQHQPATAPGVNKTTLTVWAHHPNAPSTHPLSRGY